MLVGCWSAAGVRGIRDRPSGDGRRPSQFYRGRRSKRGSEGGFRG